MKNKSALTLFGVFLVNFMLITVTRAVIASDDWKQTRSAFIPISDRAFTPSSTSFTVFDTKRFTGLSVTVGRRVVEAEIWVEIKVSSPRECLRFCWLFQACIAITYEVRNNYCQLHSSRVQRADGSLPLSYQLGSFVVDLRGAHARSTTTFARGCDQRPCSVNEMCAPVRFFAEYVCLSPDDVCTEDPPSIPNSHPLPDGLGSVAYECAEGHVATGDQRISKCDHVTGRWSDVDLSCDFIDCGSPPAVVGAVVNGQSTYAGSVVTYSCLTGAISPSQQMTSTCQARSAQWEPVPDSCAVVTCGQPPAVDNMMTTLAVRPLSGAYPGLTSAQLQVSLDGVAEYTCNDGYTPIPGMAYTSKCQPDGTWSPTDNFRCSPLDCGLPLVVNSEQVNHGATTLGEKANVTCMFGFLPSEGYSLTCDITGNWTSNGQECEPVDCGDPPTISGTDPHFNSTLFGASANYTCSGYALVENENDSVATCHEDGSWSQPTIICTEIPCGELPPLKHGFMYPYKGSSILAGYICDHGYEVRPNTEADSYCHGSGTWMLNSNRCVGVACGAAPQIENADVQETGQEYPSTATYTCLEGNKLLSEASTKTCNASGGWSDDVVVCGIPPCDLPPFLDNAEISTGVAADYSFDHGERLAITCSDGYIMTPASSTDTSIANVTIVCLEGNWTDEGSYSLLEVTCLGCGSPPDLPFSTWLIEKETPRTAIYKCDTGYSLRSEMVDNLTCLIDSRLWTDAEDLECVEIQCSEPPAVGNAEVIDNGNRKVNQSIEYRCPEGYALHGLEPIRTCERDGIWSHPFFECLKIDCGFPSPVGNASLSLHTDTYHGSLVMYSCNDGYLNSSAAITRTCGADAKWTNEFIECVPQDASFCPSPPDIEFASFEVDSFLSGGIAIYTCQHGYQHLWTNSYVCGPRFPNHNDDLLQWIGSPGAECVPIKITSTTAPGVVATVDCGQPPQIGNTQATHISGNVFGDAVHYECVEGFIHTGPSIKMCTMEGWWSSELVECVPQIFTFCLSPPPKLDHAVVHLDSRMTGAEARYSCEDGYNGAETISTCNSRGEWSQPTILCQPLWCPAATAIATAVVNPELTRHRFGTNVVHVCHTGYSTLPDLQPLSSSCLADGTWSQVDGSCNLNVVDVGESCPMPPPLEFGEVVSETGKITGSLVWYTCDSGYEPAVRVPFVRTCLPGGQWSTEMLACKLLWCDRVTPPSHLRTVALSSGASSNQTLECRPPFYLITDGQAVDDMIVCQDDGTWRFEDIKFSCATCNQSIDALGIPNGYLDIFVASGETYGDSATFKCNEHYQMIGKHNTVRCVQSENGQPEWTSLNTTRCVRNFWNLTITTAAEEQCYYPIDATAIWNGFYACMILTLDDPLESLQVGFKHESREDGGGMWTGARVEYDHKKRLRFRYRNNVGEHLITEDTIYVDLYDENRQQPDFCVTLDLVTNTYKFTKDGTELLSMEAKFTNLVEMVVQPCPVLEQVNFLYY